MSSIAAAARSRVPPRVSPLAWLLAAGFVFRLGLVYVVFPGAGFSSDLGLFESWATTLASSGAGTFYASAASANYPPGYLWVLWLVGTVGNVIGGLLGTSGATATASLLKLPAVAADLAIAWLVAGAAGRWFGGRAGLVAAAIYLFVPVTWYDSALWGQVDAVGALVMLAAALLLVAGWSELALTAAVLATLVKPQDAIVLAIVIPVLVRRHLLRIGSGPVPAFGPLLARLDRAVGGSLGGLVRDQGPRRLASSAVLAGVVGLAVIWPFDLERFAPASLADLPAIGQVAGLIGLFVRAGGEFSVLTANAYNAWALVGPTPLASAIGGGGSWTPDSLVVLAGLPAVAVGAGLLAGVGLLVSGGLLVRDGRLPILLGLAVLAFAFYAVPTRVHERYLVPFFAVGAILGAGSIRSVIAYTGIGVLNAINLHAVLAAPLRIGTGSGGGGFGGGGANGPGGRGGGPAGGGFGGAFEGGGFGSSFTSIQLPFADLARSQVVVEAVAVGQTLALIGLLAAWIVVLVRAPDRATKPARIPAAAAPSHG